ncbi:hypothetical protein M407DRAFT_244492 [Tulasnella calospora MUT 4182]|uniref:Uncharacterized protein n=1 Tax=Tulasnella calospora MUT 4182 TaxID=1051891 RepID=A0A0C3Q5D9_9AGAM|nr:hypothetical protein M407DRAFT_244492 [Tulasnella calospora MUT 4182]
MTNSHSPYCLIGGQFWKDNDTFGTFGSGQTGHLCLTPVTDPSRGPFKSLLRDDFSGTYGRGSGFCTFWNVLQDGSLLASVQQKTCAYQLEALVSCTTGWIWLVSDTEAVISKWPESQNTLAKLQLEPIYQTSTRA